jgi:hypothetical protein
MMDAEVGWAAAGAVRCGVTAGTPTYGRWSASAVGQSLGHAATRGGGEDEEGRRVSAVAVWPYGWRRQGNKATRYSFSKQHAN